MAIKNKSGALVEFILIVAWHVLVAKNRISTHQLRFLSFCENKARALSYNLLKARSVCDPLQ